MIKQVINFVILSIVWIMIHAQVSIATDNFNTPANWSLNTAVGGVVNSVVPGPNTTSTDGQATEDNRWIINNVYSSSSFTCLGFTIPASTVPAQPAQIPNTNGNYLHLISKCGLDAGALNANWNGSLTHKRKVFAAMNYDMNTTGYYSVIFSFWSYQANGISVYYSTNSGTTWQYLQDLGSAGVWAKTNISNTNFNNASTLRFGFLWDDAKGNKNHPSIDAIEISVPQLTSEFYSDKNTVCAAYQDVVTFTNMSMPDDQSVTYNWTITPGTAGVNWQFAGGTNASSKNPQIQFLTQNSYTVRLTASRSITSQTVFSEKTIEVIDGCQCSAGGGSELLIDEMNKSLTNWSPNWLNTSSAHNNWQASPAVVSGQLHFNASVDPGAYLHVVPFWTNNSFADLTWNQNLDFANTSATYTLTFSISNQGNSGHQNQIRVFVSTDSGANWTQVYIHNTNVTNWTPQTVNLTSYAGNSNVRIRIRGTRSLGILSGAWDSGIKNVVLTKVSSGGGSSGNEPTATIALTSGTIPACQGESFTFTCTATNIGTYNVTQYSWYVDGVQVQSGPSNTYTSSTLANGQSVTCAIMISDPSCTGPYTSLPITVLIMNTVTPQVSIQAMPGGYVCEGENMTFTAMYEHGGTSPTFQWVLNGNNVGTGSTYNSSQLQDGDNLQLIMTSNANCVSVNPVNNIYTHSQHDTTMVTIQSDVDLCEQAIINFSATLSNGSPPYNYQWYQNGNPAGNDPTLTLSNLSPGDEVYVVVNSQTSCDGQSNSLIIQSNSIAPTSASVSPNNFCVGGFSNITLTYSGGSLGIGATAVWYNDAALTNSVGTGNNLTIPTPNTTTTYYIVFEGDCNTTNPISVTLTINPLPIVDCPDNMIISPNEPAFTLTGASPTSGAYSGTGVSGGMFNPAPLPEGTYTITYEYTDNNGCSNLCTFTITINEGTPPEADFNSNRTTVCQGQSISFFDISTNNPTSWSWTFEGGTPNTSTAKNPVVTYNTPGVYAVTLTASNNSGSDTETKVSYITVLPLPQYTVSFTHETCIPAKDGTITIIPDSDSYTIYWNSGKTSFALNNLSPATYNYTITDTTLCSISGSITILNGTEDCNPPHVFIPNIFSPNGDGQNDIFFIRGYGIETMEFAIYNRWGNRIFESNNPDIGWNGTYKDKPCQSGVYAYFLKATLKNNRSIERAGTITLIR